MKEELLVAANAKHAQDGFGNEIKIGDTVKFATGTWRGLVGKVKKITLGGSDYTNRAIVDIPGEGTVEEQLNIIEVWNAKGCNAKFKVGDKVTYWVFDKKAKGDVKAVRGERIDIDDGHGGVVTFKAKDLAFWNSKVCNSTNPVVVKAMNACGTAKNAVRGTEKIADVVGRGYGKEDKADLKSAFGSDTVAKVAEEYQKAKRISAADRFDTIIREDIYATVSEYIAANGGVLNTDTPVKWPDGEMQSAEIHAHNMRISKRWVADTIARLKKTKAKYEKYPNMKNLNWDPAARKMVDGIIADAKEIVSMISSL